MSQLGDRPGPRQSGSNPVGGAATLAAATTGPLGGRYDLDQEIGVDELGWHLWLGTDIVLRRPVAVRLRFPGGADADTMLATAVATSQVSHPHLVSVYDAVDEGHVAYVVREWVPGTSLRDLIKQGPLDPEKSSLVTQAVAGATAALHASGIVHAKIHPGSVIIAKDGRVVLTDPHGVSPASARQADGSDAAGGASAPDATTAEAAPGRRLEHGPANADRDVRAIGGVLYACLTGRWPQAETGIATLTDALRDANGRLAAPRQVRGGIPRYLDEIASDLLDPRRTPPPAASVAAQFSHLTDLNEEPDAAEPGPMGFRDSEPMHEFEPGHRRRPGRRSRLAMGVVVLIAITALAAAYTLVRLLGGGGAESAAAIDASASATPSTGGSAKQIALHASQLRIVDPPTGDRTELAGVALTIDGNEATGWRTQEYPRANFGGLKPGMGVLIDLGRPTAVETVRVVVSQQGASVGLRTGNADPGATTAGDQSIAAGFKSLGAPLSDHAGTVMVFSIPPEQQTNRFLLIWITKLPQNSAGKFILAVNEISLYAP